MKSPSPHVSVSARVSPLFNFWMPEPVFMEFSMYLMAPEPISMAYFLNPSHQCVCLYVYPPIIARQRLDMQFPKEKTRNNRRIVQCIVFDAARVVSDKSLWVCLCIPLSLLDNSSVNTFPYQWRIVEGVAFLCDPWLSKIE
jgi:hypothetical protein